MDSPWNESGENTFKDVEWSRISSEFTNVGSFKLHSSTIPSFFSFSFSFIKRSVIVKESLQEKRQHYKKDLMLGLLILEHLLVEN
jgi:hypothetical protein